MSKQINCNEKLLMMSNFAEWRNSLLGLEMPKMPELTIEVPKKEEPKILTINKKEKSKGANEGGLW